MGPLQEFWPEAWGLAGVSRRGCFLRFLFFFNCSLICQMGERCYVYVFYVSYGIFGLIVG